MSRLSFLVALLALALNLPPASAKSSVSVGGFGLFGNAELKNSLRLLEMQQGEIDAKKIDDGAFLILTRLSQNGYLDATLDAEYTTTSGSEGTASWRLPFDPQIPSGVVVNELHYKTNPGMLYFYDRVEIQGLTAMTEEEARQYFIPSRALISRKKDRSYSPSILSRHRKQLSAALATLGYADAKVSEAASQIDKGTGAVSVQIVVEEGPLYKVTEAEVRTSSDDQETETETVTYDHIYNRSWIDSEIRKLRNESYNLGYPDTRVTSQISHTEMLGEIKQVFLIFEVNRGPRITISEIEHAGATDTHENLLDRKARLTPGEPLDLTETEAARRRLSELGIFNRIELTYEPAGDGERKVIFDYANSKRVEMQLLLGYGSYESLRAGFIASRKNLFGRAHSLNFEAIQSVKSTSSQLDYQIPELLGESIDASFEALYLNREEINFEREERGVTAGLSTRLRELGIDVGLDYAFEFKRSSNPEIAEEFGLSEANIGSVSLRASRSTIDNLLYPRNGYEITGAVRYASEALGGESEFMKSELGASYHTELGDLWLFHISAKAGTITAPPYRQNEIPYNERFLIGGENSLRGYRRGNAGPIDAESGLPVAVQSFALLNVEVEYPIFDKLNIVLFTDAARSWRYSYDSDSYVDLYDAGIGFRYQTIVGPVRLEYGHNLNPRPTDPEGTVHLSVGFPF